MVKIEKDKHVYAAYANLAQHNFFQTMRHIIIALKLGNPGEDENAVNKIIDNLKSSKDVVLTSNLCRLLVRHLPFLSPMEVALKDEKGDYKKPFIRNQKEALLFLVERIKTTLNFYRNYTTHFNPDEDDNIVKINKYERDLMPCLKNLLLSAIRVVQQRFGYSEYEVSFIKNKNMGKGNYKYCLYKKELVSANDDKPSNIFSLKGLTLFISLFLEKKYISEMLAKTQAFYHYDDLRNKLRKSILFETIAVYRIKTPRIRLETEKDETTALALDMLNELQRCPKELFELLSPKEQKLFRAKSSLDEMDEVLMLRHNDRFPFLALKYIDTLKVFNDIRFQIALGNYRYAFYEKHCIDSAVNNGEPRVRSLQKALHGFGRLNEIEAERAVKWASLIRDFEDVEPDTALSTPFITDHKAAYLINNNKIALYWKASKDDPFPGLPQLPQQPQARDLLSRKRNREQLISLTTPKCFLSTHELPALVFYHLLYNELMTKDSKAIKEHQLPNAEKIIKASINNYRKLFSAIAAGEVVPGDINHISQQFNIDLRILPKKIQDFLSGKQFDNTKNNARLEARLQQLIDDTAKKIQLLNSDLEKIADKNNKHGKKNYVEIKPGLLGAWLAKDIIALQPAPQNGQNKLTGLNFRILQSTLSIFESLETVKRLLTSAKLINADYQHPFLNKVVELSPNNTIEFYNLYLCQRETWLKSLQGKNLLEFNFISRGVSKWDIRDASYYKRTAQSYLNLPIELPRGLFHKGIQTLLSLLRGNDFIKGSARDDANVSFLINKYLNKCMNDESQCFYTQPDKKFKRNYRFFQLLRGEKATALSISEIEQYLRSDVSLQLLSGSSNVVSVPERLLNDIKLKLAKAKAKKPNLNTAQKIQQILTSSPIYKTLSTAQHHHIISSMASSDNQISEVKLRLESADKSEKQSLRNSLSAALHYMKANERLLRRYRTQDIIIFLMARDILLHDATKTLGNKFDALKLKNILPIGLNNSITTLEIKVPFSIVLKFKDGNSLVIHQKQLKLKNYGDFYKFLNDNRIPSLIPYLNNRKDAIKITVEREDLEHELGNYDRERHNIFENVHRLEKLILNKHRELLDRSDENYFYVDTESNKSLPVRNNFNRLLQQVDNLQQDKRQEIVNIRNAFSHNTYGKDKVNIQSQEIGYIAKEISEIMSENSDEIQNL